MTNSAVSDEAAQATIDAWVVALFAAAGADLSVESFADGQPVDPELAAALADYVACDAWFAQRVATGSEGGAFVEIERDLGVWRQATGDRDTRADLRAVYDALSELPEAAEALPVLLAASVDVDAATRSDAIRVLSHDDAETVVEVRCEEPFGGRSWPLPLGGEAAPGEFERVFTLTIRRAKWRDRALRRLRSVQITALELHADPTPFLPSPGGS